MSVESINNIHGKKNSSPENNSPVVGVLGGIGSGKSAVAKWVSARNSVCLIDGDQIGHEVLLLDKVKQAVRHQFGDKVFW